MKTVCVYHSIDLDGWMSAAIVYLWFTSQPKEIVELNTKEDGEYTLDLLGYNYGDPIPDLSAFDRVIMCDVSFPAEEMSRLNMSLGYNDFIWIDHHVSAIRDYHALDFPKRMNDVNGIRNTDFAACELTWSFFFPDKIMPEIVRLLGRYDCFGHKGTEEEKYVLEFQYGARGCITNYQDAYLWLQRDLGILEMINPWGVITIIHEKGKAIYLFLCADARQTYKNGFPLMFGKHKFICFNKERFNLVNFGIDYHAAGYDGAACFSRLANKNWTFSLYNDNDTVDCSVIAKQYGGGGHRGAAGFILNDNDFIKLITKTNGTD